MGTVVTLRVGLVVPRTMAEGPGPRGAVWVQGCSLGCHGCVNPHLWPESGGRDMDVVQILDELAEGFPVEGLTLLGGEPFDQAEAVGDLAAAAQDAGLSVMTFTGYRYENLIVRPEAARLLAATDLLIDGPYVASRPDRERPWVGSTNQRFLALTSRYQPLVAALPPAREEVEIHLLPDGRVRVTGTPVPALLDAVRHEVGSSQTGVPTWTKDAQ